MKNKFYMLILGVILIGAVSVKAEEKNGKYPFFPSLINTNTGKPVKSADFEQPEVCRACHTDIYNQWKGSMHSNAFIDPVFQALWKIGNKETNGLTEKLCAGCHTAIGTVSDELGKKDAQGNYAISEVAQQGVQCDVCHTVKSSTSMEAEGHEPHNATLIIEPGTKRGPFKEGDSPHHAIAYSELHTTAEFCANCHHVFHPVNNFPIERTYDEWKNSVYNQNGIICQDCHMADVEDAVEIARTLKKVQHSGKASNSGPEREHIYKHNFDGANFTIPGLLGYTKHSEAAAKRLQSAAKVEIISPDEFKEGRMGAFKIKVTNVAAGHNLPTSLTEVRQMWLEVEVTDEAGKKILHSGWLDKDFNVDPEAAMFHAKSVDKDGNHTVKPWEIVRFEYNTTIPPKGSATQNYNFEIPSGAKGNLQVKAILRYRSYPQAVANLLLGKGAPVLPIVDMTTASKSVKIIKG